MKRTRKVYNVLLCMFLLSGCSLFPKNSSDSESIQKYETYLNALIEQTRFSDSSPAHYYDISAVINPLDDGTYRYDVFIENPQIAMYSIEILVIENTTKRTDTIIYPCVGIFENEDYTMIPFQKNASKGFVEAFDLSGVTTTATPELLILVTWKDYAKLQTYREFIALQPALVQENNEEHEVIPDAE